MLHDGCRMLLERHGFVRTIPDIQLHTQFAGDKHGYSSSKGLSRAPGVCAKYASLQEVIGRKIQGCIWCSADERRPKALKQRSATFCARHCQNRIQNTCVGEVTAQGMIKSLQFRAWYGVSLGPLDTSAPLSDNEIVRSALRMPASHKCLMRSRLECILL